MDYSKLKVGDKVTVCNSNGKVFDSQVTRVTKTKVIVSRPEKHRAFNSQVRSALEQWFRRSDGYDMGPITRNVYFLKMR